MRKAERKDTSYKNLVKSPTRTMVFDKNMDNNLSYSNMDVVLEFSSDNRMTPKNCLTVILCDSEIFKVDDFISVKYEAIVSNSYYIGLVTGKHDNRSKRK